MKKLTSIQNPFVKLLVSLKEKAKERKRKQAFLIEGKREIDLAFKGGYDINTILFYPGLCDKYEVEKWSSKTQLIEVSKEVFKKLAYRDSTEGAIAVAKAKSLGLANLHLGKNPLVLVVQSIEKPGNIGAILRTADAANIDAVIIADPTCDIYNPNVIRSSVGCLFTNQVVTTNSGEAIKFLEENKINIYCASLQNAICYDTKDYKNASAFIVGNEAGGLSEIWRDSIFQHITIPMQGEIDSMNVSVSAAILIFEAKRQRGF